MTNTTHTNTRTKPSLTKIKATAKALYKAKNGNFRGFELYWKSQIDTNPKLFDLIHPSEASSFELKEESPITSYALVEQTDGWSVITIKTSGDKVISASTFTESEPKHFAVLRLLSIFKRQLHEIAITE